MTVNGKPLTAGMITFVDKDGKGVDGMTFVDGEYRLNTTPGQKLVEIRSIPGEATKERSSAPKSKTAATKNQNSLPDPKSADALPDRYNDKTALTADVAAGTEEDNTFNFE